MKPKFLLFILLFLPFLSACNSTDDVGRIFTGKTWKLTRICEENTYDMVNLWSDNAQKTASMGLLNKENNFVITFDGTEDKSLITGTFNGRGANKSYNNSTWRANGESNEYKTTKFESQGSKETDILAKVYIEGIESATRYSGDENNLYLYFTYENKTIRLAFGVKKN